MAVANLYFAAVDAGTGAIIPNAAILVSGFPYSAPFVDEVGVTKQISASAPGYMNAGPVTVLLDPPSPGSQNVYFSIQLTQAPPSGGKVPTASTAAVQVNVVDAASGEQVIFPKIFLNGKPLASNPVTVVIGTVCQFSANAPNYQSSSKTITAGGDALITIPLTRSTLTGKVTLQFSPAVANIQFQLAGSKSFGGFSDATGKAQVSGVPADTYDVTAKLAGYNDASVVAVINGDASIPVVLDKTADQGVNETPAPELPAIPVADIVEGLRQPAPDPEVIPDNADWNGYYTGAQVRVYMGNLFIDELQSLQWTSQGNRIPLYGYASRFADGFATGRFLVQGQILINYVTEGYLFTHIQEVTDLQSSIGSLDREQADRIQALLQAKAKAQSPDSVKLFQQNGDKAGLTNAVNVNQKLTSAINSKLASLITNPNAVRMAKQKPAAKSRIHNAIYLNQPFDLMIEIGTDANRTVRRLEACVLTTNDVVFDQSGRPLAEAYGFIARRGM